MKSDSDGADQWTRGHIASKAFVLLSDVGEENGPCQHVLGSHRLGFSMDSLLFLRVSWPRTHRKPERYCRGYRLKPDALPGLILEVSIGQAGAFGCSASALELSGLSCLRFAFRPGKLLARKEQIFKETATMWKNIVSKLVAWWFENVRKPRSLRAWNTAEVNAIKNAAPSFPAHIPQKASLNLVSFIPGLSTTTLGFLIPTRAGWTCFIAGTFPAFFPIASTPSLSPDQWMR